MQSEHTYFDPYGRSWTLTAYPALRKVLAQLDGEPFDQAELYGDRAAIFPTWATDVTDIPSNIIVESEALWHEMTGGGHV